jgi:hypothetical protein
MPNIVYIFVKIQPILQVKISIFMYIIKTEGISVYVLYRFFLAPFDMLSEGQSILFFSSS